MEDAGDIAVRVASALEAEGISYAIGGALAMGVHGYPRGTLDEDLKVFVEEDGLSEPAVSLGRCVGRVQALVLPSKDRVDLERFVAVRRARMDHAYVREWIAEMMGEDDPRVLLWDDLVTRFG